MPEKDEDQSRMEDLVAAARRHVHAYKEEYSFTQAVTLAAKLRFVAAVELVCGRWDIPPRLPAAAPQGLDEDLAAVEGILRAALSKDGSRPVTREAWEELHTDLRHYICKPFGLDWTRDYGLIVAAVCYRFTTENLWNHWDVIGPVAWSTASPAANLIEVRTSESEVRWATALTIGWLLSELAARGLLFNELPEPVRRWVSYLITDDPASVFAEDAEAAELILEELHPPDPDDPDLSSSELYLHIAPDTLLEDVVVAWPQIRPIQAQMRKAQPELHPPSRPRAARDLLRNLELYELYVREGGNLEAAVKAFDTRHRARMQASIPKYQAAHPDATEQQAADAFYKENGSLFAVYAFDLKGRLNPDDRDRLNKIIQRMRKRLLQR